MNDETLNNIYRMQEYWIGLSRRQRIDIYYEATGVDLRSHPIFMGYGDNYDKNNTY